MRTTTGASRTLVASCRPPRPGLDDGDVHLGRGELRERGRRQRLELRRAHRLGLGPDARRARPRGRPPPRPPGSARDQETTCGDVYAPGLEALGEQQRLGRRAPSSSSRSCRRRGSPRTPRSGLPRRPSSSRIRPSPNSSGQGLSDSSQARLLSRRAHRARAGSAPASRARPRPPRAARSRRSARCRACPRSARPPCAAARSRRRGCRSAGSCSLRTTASKMRRSSSGSSTTTPLRRAISAASRTRSSAPASSAKRASGSGHGETIRRASRSGQLRPDLLGHVRHHRVEEGEQALERRRARSRPRRGRPRRAAA